MIDIIGAGIGGLTLANALEQKGIEYAIYEQAKELKTVGAGIILATNAMQVFDILGLKEEIEQSGYPLSSIRITNNELEPISNVDLNYFTKKYNVKTVGIHRGALQKILVNKLNRSQLYLDHKLLSIANDGQGVVVDFGEHQTNSKVLIGADGINSVVRQHIDPERKIRLAEQICWRGVTHFTLPEEYKKVLFEAWGHGNRFGFVEIAKDYIYWYAVQSSKGVGIDTTKNRLLTHFDSYHSLIKNIIESTDENEIHLAEMSDLSPNDIWYKKNICLIGDAAHATTPNLGQGACQAIEDGFVLADCLEKYDHQTAFSEFQKLRTEKANKVVKDSWKIGKLAHWENPFAVSVRNTMMKMTPDFVNKKQSEKLFQLHYEQYNGHKR